MFIIQMIPNLFYLFTIISWGKKKEKGIRVDALYVKTNQNVSRYE